MHDDGGYLQIIASAGNNPGMRLCNQLYFKSLWPQQLCHCLSADSCTIIYSVNYFHELFSKSACKANTSVINAPPLNHLSFFTLLFFTLHCKIIKCEAGIDNVCMKQSFNSAAYQPTAYGAVGYMRLGGEYIAPSAFDTSAVNDCREKE